MAQRSGGGRGRGRQDPNREPLSTGVRIRDVQFDREGEIVDVARQYTHPQAAPIFNYLVRWQHGQVQALGESALQANHGIEILD